MIKRGQEVLINISCSCFYPSKSRRVTSFLSWDPLWCRFFSRFSCCISFRVLGFRDGECLERFDLYPVQRKCSTCSPRLPASIRSCSSSGHCTCFLVYISIHTTARSQHWTSHIRNYSFIRSAWDCRWVVGFQWSVFRLGFLF